MAQDQYQTVKEVADRLKVAEATVRHWTKEGQFRAIDIGKGWRIADSDLAGVLLTHQTGPRIARAVLNGSGPDGDAKCRT